MIIRYNTIGVVLNLALCLMKILVGVSANAHSVILDGVNSLTDVTFFVLSIISSIIGSKKASRKHPMGFGRVEYIFSLIIIMVILYIGVKSIIDSIGALLDPHDPPVLCDRRRLGLCRR